MRENKSQKSLSLPGLAMGPVLQRGITSLLAGAALLASAILVLTGCDAMRDGLETIRARGYLKLITRNSSTTYFEGPNGPAGFEYDLAEAFADHLGVSLKVVVREDEEDMITALATGRGDILAPGFPLGRRVAKLVYLGPSYLDVNQQVIGRRGRPDVTRPADLKGRSIWYAPSSARQEALEKLKRQVPSARWVLRSSYSSEDLLDLVQKRSADLTVVESNTFTSNRWLYPELVVHFSLEPAQQLRWAIGRQNHRLQQAVKHWFALPKTGDLIRSLIKHYYGHLERFDYVDLVRFRKKISSHLPRYIEYFKQAAARYGLNWMLVAAQSYQESHWNPRARSFTGVRGMMMLTLDTARDMGVKNRMAARESIFAGTRYLARLHNRIEEKVPEPDRTYLALAAYNLGFGHLQDARLLAARLGKPADTWRTIRDVLPLLQQKKYYRTLPHGYARGKEAVQYVDRIRTYYDVLRDYFGNRPRGFF